MKRVFLVSRHLLFGSGLENLLRPQGGIEIVGQETDLERAFVRIREAQPDVVIAGTDLPECEEAALALGLFGEGLRPTVIALNPQDNTLFIYPTAERTVHQVTDLLQAIESNESPFSERSEKDVSRNDRA
jgi:DNA-binding NarL/FixJ family response regulator